MKQPAARRKSKARLARAGGATISAGAMFASLALGAAPAHAATAPTGWVATRTESLALTRATSLGAAPAATPMSITLSLAVQNQARLASLAENASTPGRATFGHFMSASQAVQEFSPTAAQAGAVAAWLRQSGFSNVAVQPDRLVVSGDADAALVERTFDTSLGLFSWKGSTVYSNTAPAMVPARFGGLVDAVLGLNDVAMNLPYALRPAHPTVPPAIEQRIARPAATGQGTPVYPNLFTPQQLATVYNASSLPNATATTIAVFGSGDMTGTIADLRTAEKADSAPVVPVTVAYTATPSAINTDNPYTGNAEWDLDTQTSTQVAGAVKDEIIYDMETIDDGDLTRAISLFVSQDQAITGSASLAECDFQSYLDGAMFAVDGILEEGAIQGQSLFAGTGDWGAACPVAPSNGVPDSGPPAEGWPADGTWTTASGGTSLLTDSSDNYVEEITWYAGGGGVSEFESGGNWSGVANPATANDPDLITGGRGIPDLSADADPETGENVYTSGGAEGIGGTSLAGPLLMGLWARIQGVHDNDLGVASIDAYTLYNAVNAADSYPQSDPPGFNDITVGTNGIYTALPGYDLTTGIGSYNVAALSTALSAQPGGGQVPEAPVAVLVPSLGALLAFGLVLRRRRRRSIRA